MKIEDLKKYSEGVKAGKTIILDYLEKSFFALVSANFIPEYIICDPEHRNFFRLEIKYFSSPRKIEEVSESFTVIAINGHKLKVLTRIEEGKDAFKGIELYGRCK